MKNTTIKKAALYDPYLDVIGGGEKHILSILKVLDDNGYEITIFWNKNLSEKFKLHLNISFHHLTFKPSLSEASFLSKATILKKYDLFIYVPDGSYFYSSAKKNVIFCMVPNKKLYSRSLINKIKTYNIQFVTNSKFTSNWLTKWGIQNQVIYPYISNKYFQKNDNKREKTILMVGRFFTHLHAKRQDMGIEWFQQLKRLYPSFGDYNLVLVGMVKEEDKPYFQNLKNKFSRDSSIVFKPNSSFTELLGLYQSSQFYWHFAGYGVDEEKHPENVEHLGITPLEAMASGCITCAYATGGPKEIISQGKTGLLFTTQDELYHQMNDLITTPSKIDHMRKMSYEYVQKTFSYRAFQKRVIAILKL